MVNDTSYMLLIVTFFVASAIIVPLIQADFNTAVTQNRLGNIIEGIGDSKDLGFAESTSSSSFEEIEMTGGGSSNVSSATTSSVTTISPLIIIRSIGLMFLWTFGQIPTIIDLLIYAPLRIILLFLIIRFFRGSS